jgi:hypothetical protein
MRIEVYSRYGDIGFVVHAESVEDRAILSLVTSNEYTKNKSFFVLGSTYSCDVSAVTSFNFGWAPQE